MRCKPCSWKWKVKIWKEYAEQLSNTLHLPVNYNDWEGNHIAVPSWDSYFAPKAMKWVKWDWSAIARVGMTRTDWRSMFSVWNLVAFESSWYCSPDWRQSAGWVNLLKVDYKLQDEIDIKEYDNTEVDKYWKWSYDVQEEITFKPIFLHEEKGINQKIPNSAQTILNQSNQIRSENQEYKQTISNYIRNFNKIMENEKI